jgi:hypothetical protein
MVRLMVREASLGGRILSSWVLAGNVGCGGGGHPRKIVATRRERFAQIVAGHCQQRTVLLGADGGRAGHAVQHRDLAEAVPGE